MYPKLAKPLRHWVRRFDGNLVLTDAAMGMLQPMKIIKGTGVAKQDYYAGYVNFSTTRREVTYDDPLAKKINQPGAAEGMSCNAYDQNPCAPGDTPEIHRRQTYEPVPLGYALQSPDGGDMNASPVWYIEQPKFAKAWGKQRSIGTTGELSQISYGEIKLSGGVIRFIGALLPMPSDKFDHPFGLANYGVTYAGYQMLKNMLTWSN